MANLKLNKYSLIILLFILASNVSGHRHRRYLFGDTCYNLYYTNFCSFCYNKNNVMYFLRYVDYDKRCDFMEIGEQTEIPRSKIASEQDDFMKNQTETAQNHYKEYKDERNKTMSEAYKKIEEKIDKLPSNDTKTFARQIYAIMKNESLSKKEEYQQAHSLVARTNFETVKNASELIPSKFFADRYGGRIMFYFVYDPLEAVNYDVTYYYL